MASSSEFPGKARVLVCARPAATTGCTTHGSDFKSHTTCFHTKPSPSHIDRGHRKSETSQTKLLKGGRGVWRRGTDFAFILYFIRSEFQIKICMKI